MSTERNAAIPVVILCGGRGLRMGHRSLPKPLADVGGMPILWHVMAIYASQGFTNFVLCLGHRGDEIRKAVRTFSTGWNVRFVDTGDDTPTGGRVARVAHLLQDGSFCLTYADGLADIDLDRLVDFHFDHGRDATMTVVRPDNPWGVAQLGDDDLVVGFEEKPRLDTWVNGGFMVMEPECLQHIGASDVLEREPMERLARDGELSAFRHEGFWECMDTYKDAVVLNDMWDEGTAPWRERVLT